MNKTEKMLHSPVITLVAEFWVTSLIPLVLYSAFTLTDAYFVSRFAGAEELGGISIVLPFTVIQGTVSQALGGGSSVFVSRYLGKGDNKKASMTALNAMSAFWITALLVTALGLIFANPVLKILGASGSVCAHAKKYYVILVAGNVFSTGFSSIIRAEGATAYGTLIWIIPISLNIIFDYVFVAVCGLGVAGSAYATLICQVTSFIMSIFFFSRLSVLNFKGLKPRFHELIPILRTGIPSLVLSASTAATLALVNNALSLFGETDSVSIYAYANRLISFAVMPFTAFVYTVIPLCGANHAAGRRDRSLKILKLSCFMSVAGGLLIALILYFSSDMFTEIFTGDQGIISGVRYVMKIVSPSLAVMPLPMIFGAFCQTIGKIKVSLIIYALCTIILAIVIFPASFLFGSRGTYISACAAYYIALPLSSILIAKELKKYSKI